MSKHTSESNMSGLADGARVLLEATVDVVGDKVDEARQRVMATLEKAKRGVHATDRAVQQNPYKTIAIAAGTGLVLGYLFVSRCSKKSESAG
jgi:ElaB/YqjD/DUF883 family membrane-anchored ribosome-binding protein